MQVYKADNTASMDIPDLPSEPSLAESDQTAKCNIMACATRKISLVFAHLITQKLLLLFFHFFFFELAKIFLLLHPLQLFLLPPLGLQDLLLLGLALTTGLLQLFKSLCLANVPTKGPC
jgi:hypothetical protein